MKLAYTGDLVLQEIEGFSKDELFGSLKEILLEENAELIINLESPFIREGMKKTKSKVCLYSDSNSINYLEYLAPKIVNLANNHINDFGIESCFFTQKLLKDKNIRHFGVGTIDDTHKHIDIDEDNKVIQIAYVTRSSDLSGIKLFAGNNFIGGYDISVEEIKEYRLKYKDYKLIINIHWGMEDIKYPEPEKVEIGHTIIDAGADLIVGHHSHVVQPVEVYKGKYIFYSVGNFYTADIHYECDGKDRFFRMPASRRVGIIPVIEAGKEVGVDSVYKIKRNRRGSSTKIYKVTIDGLVLKHTYSAKRWNSYYRSFLWGRRIKIVLCNPFYIPNKIWKAFVGVFKSSPLK